jgi:hypothetical protein
MLCIEQQFHLKAICQNQNQIENTNNRRCGPVAMIQQDMVRNDICDIGFNLHGRGEGFVSGHGLGQGAGHSLHAIVPVSSETGDDVANVLTRGYRPKGTICAYY